PETFTYRQLVEKVRQVLGVRRVIAPMPPSVGYWAGRLLGLFLGDVVITREEIRGLMEGRLCVDAPPLGTTRLSDWVSAHRATLGLHYTSEMARRTDRASAYRAN
ncbi:MAG TPA: epimerase, partial [Verrucomicrobiae bacterium]|nr:epimerase [Verrucomicrobiae bacterium]